MKFAAARGNVRIGFDVIGRGTPVMLLHDFGENSGSWYESGCVKACLARGRQVILVDLRGHGEDSTPVDALACEPIHCCWDVVAVLDQAGIGRTDVLGVGVGGRIALCMAAFATERVHAVAAGGAHPYAERVNDASKVSAVSWTDRIHGKLAGGHPAFTHSAALGPNVVCDWPDISHFVTRSGVPILLFVGTDEPRYALVTSFAEQSSAKLIVVSNSKPTLETEILTRVLDFFDDPAAAGAERLPPLLWSGSWG
jgi:pimeloyl-ACP methyl ester carboxylesterase